MCRAHCKGLHQTLFRCFSSQQTYKKESTFGRETAEKSGAVEIQWRTAVYFSNSGKGRKTVLGNSLACSGGAGRLLSPPVAKAPKGLRTATSLQMIILSKRQDSPCENRANGCGAGTERKCANLTCPRECRMKAESRSSRHSAVRHGTPCGWNPPPASAPQGEWLAKGQTGFARRRTPSRAGKAFRSPVFPVFLHPQELLCGKKVSSLRKAVHFFAESNSVFTAKKRPPERRNAPHKQFLHPVFNSPSSACSRPFCH